MTTPDAGSPVAATTFAENRQKITVSSEDYATEKGNLSIDGDYYFKINNVSYKKVTVSDGTAGEGTSSTKDAWDAASSNYKKTVTDDAAFATEKGKLSTDGDYYFKITSSSVTYKKVTRYNGGKTEDNSDVSEWTDGEQYNFNVKLNALSPGTQIIVNDDVDHTYTYKVINNAKKLAVEGTQTKAEAITNGYAPYLPEEAQTPLLDDEKDYQYYGSATESSGTYTMVDATKLFTLCGLYDDEVYVRYSDYDAETTPYLVPNKRNATGGTVARAEGSNDVAMNISGGLPYNIIWETDNMMSTTTEDATTITDGGARGLSGEKKYVWYFEGDDPYALKIRHKESSNYVDGTSTLVASAASAKEFMLLKKSGYDYGILQVTGVTGADAGKKLTGYGGELTANASTDPTKFIIFGLSVHDLIYHLIIAKTCPDKDNPQSGEYVDIPFMESESGTPTTKRIYGTTQRDLTTTTTVTGDTYQLGTTLSWGNPATSHTYSHDAGTVSIGDVLEIPSVFYRPNCTFEYYIEGVYDYNKDTGATTANASLNAKYKGLNLKNLMSDAALIDKTVVVNIVYQFDQSVATNTGLGFVTSVDKNLWYTMETIESGTPHLARYTSTGGLNTAAGRELHYTNDFLWTPLGDVYGFYMYNRYAKKNLVSDNVMTTSVLADGTAVTMDTKSANSIYELIAGAEEGTFRFHPVANNSGTRVYVTKDSDGSLKLASTSPSEWAYGLDLALMQPYYLGAGNVGGLNAAGVTAYEDAMAAEPFKIYDVQTVVYNDANIVHFTPGYYRLHSQPGVAGISPVRYASGYLHDIEKTVVSGGIPMHFYSKQGVLTSFGEEGLKNGYTVTNATQGDIPIAPTENDPSTIFYVTGYLDKDNNTISNVTMSTQGLNVIGNKMGTETATTYRMIDIGGGVVVLVNPNDGNKYFNYNQTSDIYDLKYSVADGARIDDVKWCMEPANNLGLKVTMNNGGDNYYYATFYAPFDVLLPADDGDKKYYAYVCSEWNDKNMHPAKVEAHSPYAAGKFVPAKTPVIFRTTDTSGSISLTLPTSTPALSPLPCDFIGQYLEQMLAVDADHDVYTFGLPFTSDIEIDRSDGSIDSPGIEQATTGVGFYINANPNKEADESQSLWLRNNRYVQHNKIYYRGTGAGARQDRAPQFVPVIFDDEEDEQELLPDGSQEEMAGDGCIYDLSGRKLVDEQRVKDGTWKNNLTPGVYIMSGKKIIVK